MRLKPGPRTWVFAGIVPALAALLLGAACTGPAPSPAEGPAQPAAAPPGPARAAAPGAPGRGWPVLGGTIHRNLVNTVDKGLPATWSVQKGKEQNVKWVARLGGTAFGGPVVAGGKVFVGTNNDKPRDPKVK